MERDIFQQNALARRLAEAEQDAYNANEACQLLLNALIRTYKLIQTERFDEALEEVQEAIEAVDMND